MKSSESFPPSSLIEKWENEAISQGVSVYEIGNFMKMKENLWRENSTIIPEQEKIYTNDSCNKLTEYGKKIVFEKIMEIPTVERIVKIARLNFENLRAKINHGFANEVQKDIFVAERDYWFSHLKDVMREHRISKETLAAFGLNWNDCKSLAFLAV